MTILEPQHPNRYLDRNFAPVREEVTAFDLPVEGQVPAGLAGRLLRIGPNPVLPGDPATYHWFTGTGMVHGVRLRDGRAEWYRNRFVADDTVTAALGREPTPGPRHGVGPNVVNTNVIGHAGATYGLVEAGGLPMLLDYELRTIARTSFGGTLPGGFTAHPKLDPATGELHAVSYYWQDEGVRYLVVGADGAVRRTVDVPTPGRPMVHDMGLTSRYALILDLPVTFSMEAAQAGMPLPYRWDPGYGARVGLLPRDGGPDTVRWCELDRPCYVFHPVNAYDAPDGTVVVDVVRYDTIFATDRRGPGDGPPTLVRWTVDPAGGRVREQLLDDRAQEFPRHDERLVGARHRFAYCVTLDERGETGRLLKHDLAHGKSEEVDYGAGRVSLEAVFVPRTPDSAEDDGWLMSYVYDATTDRSDVVILHAQELSAGPVAVVHLPQRVPFGFHGNWVTDVS
ncbi:MAG TPA: carotenoid oxygenase family protein [Mycobacteriales bacterium]|nr:carotenoid oxygenase family protein [Mycobacteriales bacterium]